MIQSLFILSSTGEVIIEKHWRGVLSRSICNEFWDHVCKAESPEEVIPVITTSKHYLIHVYRNGLFFLSTVQTEVPPLLVIEFLNRTIEIFEDYFGEVNEDAIKENFVTVYQLLDEMLDNGLPLTTEPNVLKSMILPPSLANKIMASVGGQSSVRSALPDGSMSNVPWRRQGIKYASNEIYFDVIEELDCIIDSNGLVISSDISGEIQCNCRLTGMPDLTLTLNNPTVIDDCSFHPCVRYARYQSDRIISFVPADGVFRLMTYRVRQQVQPPLYVKPQITISNGQIRVNVMVGSKQVLPKAIEEVVVTIPLPKTVSSANLTANFGHAVFDEINKVCKWDIGRIPKDKTPVLSGTATLMAGQPVPDGNPPLSVDFKISMYSISGLKIDSLNIMSEKYKPFKGARSLTKAGKFQIRC
mmetsp:Transcript_31012/g.50167  ORF Transcript_31012/g.50167 Transcript_31012/m.50167 type:complete len:415 (+) Transcript_31012:81-1325(+)